MLSLLDPLRLARTIAIAGLRAVRLGGDAVRIVGGFASDLSDGALGVLRAQPSADRFAEQAEDVARTAVTPPEPGRDAPLAPRPRPARPRPARQRPAGTPRGPSYERAGPEQAAPSAAASPTPVTDPAVAQEPPLPPDTAPEAGREEDRLVAAVADPGAEDGAGAEVQVDEPWRGYSKMRAIDIVDRLGAEPQAVVSVAMLYERAHRRRRTVLDAAERELGRRTAAAYPSR